MSKKSILFSILSILLFVASIFAIVFVFKTQFLLGIVSILLLFIPAFLQRKAIEEASGTVDKFIAKYVVLILAVVIGLIAIMALAFWIK